MGGNVNYEKCSQGKHRMNFWLLLNERYKGNEYSTHISMVFIECGVYKHYFSWFSHYSKHEILPFSKYLRNNFLYIIVMAFIVIFTLACVNILFQYNCLLLRHITTLSSDYYRPLFIYLLFYFVFSWLFHWKAFWPLILL